MNSIVDPQSLPYFVELFTEYRFNVTCISVLFCFVYSLNLSITIVKYGTLFLYENATAYKYHIFVK